MPSTPRRTLVFLAGSLTACVIGAAGALPASADIASLDVIEATPLTAVLGGTGLLEEGESVPAPDPSITQTRVVRIETDAENPRLQTWYVDSAAMSRTIAVDVLRADDPSVPAPMLYLLDGVDSPTPSDWLTKGHADEVLADEQVTVVMPTGAEASMYTDWIADDPVLSRNKWETFLTDELPPLLESGDDAVPFNGKRAIAGLSMGASGALGIAALHPEMYSAVAGISGCYSTLSDDGYVMAKATVESRRGDVSNMWGPRDDPQWARHDVISHADAFTGKSIYLSASPGIPRPGELESAYDGDVADYLGGAALERLVDGCTHDFAGALEGVDADVQIDYLPTGLHNWQNFGPQLTPAWEHMRGALY